jgi:sodium/potassium-transporting ATPase subunit alpha
MDEHKLKLETLFKRLKSSASGLTSLEAKERLAKNGPNVLEEKKKDWAVIKFLKQFTNFFAILLMFGSLLAFFSEYLSPGEGNLYIGIALAAVVVLNAIFTFIQEYKSEKIMESFKKMMPAKIEVIRDGKISEILAADVVIGDIMVLNEGDKIPADGRLIEENSLKVDNSSLTGESEPQLRKLECTHQNKLESRNMVFSGTLVQSGNGKALVYATGMNTEIGKIAQLTKETRQTESPLKKELRRFIKIISAIALVLGVVFFFVSIFLGNQRTGSLIFAIGIIVANVPEGLLPTVTLSLSMASKKMAKKNALIKNLESVETLGSTTVICTDKTGTITENKMSVNTLFFNMDERNIYEKNISSAAGFEKALEVFSLCNNSRLDGDNYYGDPTEGALLVFTKKFINIGRLISERVRIHESPFDSKTKRMITTNEVGGKKIAYMKGAPEVVLDRCSKIFLNNKIVKIKGAQKQKIVQAYTKIASRGERVLGLAFKYTKKMEPEEDFVFIGLVGMMDPPRKEIPIAISKCKEAGIKVIMITGDYSLTAEAVARQVGMISGEAKVTTGEALNKMNDKALERVLKEDNLIFARSTPAQKLRIVKRLQAMGHVVTVTGDGVNDAPALKNADMGVAMGVNGTDVAKEAADMVLLDDNFATIVNAVEEGRTVFENIKKFIAYILTSNVPEILPFIAFVLFRVPLALTVVLILSIDLGTDLLPALGLGAEKPESDVMKKPPRSRKERLLTSNLLFMSYGIIGVLQAAAGFFSFFTVLKLGGWHYGEHLAFSNPLYMKAVTAFFVSVVICQIADVMICRTRRQSVFKAGLFSNRLILLGIFTEIAIITVLTYVPFANIFFGTAHLSLFEISLSIPFALVILFGDELRKWMIRRGNKFITHYINW